MYFRSGTVRYAPREELERILTVLLSPMFREMPRLQGLVAAPVPPAGAVPAMCRIEPESGLASVRSARGSVKYRLRAKGAEIRLDRIENGDVIRLSFPAEMAEPAEKLREILRLPLSAEPGDDPGDREITLQSGEKRYAPAEALFACMEALEETLNADRSGAVGIEYIPVVPQLMGAVVCPTETLRPQPAFPGMIPAAPRPAPAVYPVLNRDGTWDCACGTKGLTSKFCPECGSGKPTAWRCVQCGSENTGRFCTECGARRPEN